MYRGPVLEGSMELGEKDYGGVDGLRTVFGQCTVDVQGGLLAVVRSAAEDIARLARSRTASVGVAK